MTMSYQTLLHISDTHLMSSPEKAFVQVNPEDNFHQLMSHIQKQHPHIDCVVHTGDLAQEATPETYQRYLNYMKQTGLCFYQTPGNHDDLACFPFSQHPITIINRSPWLIILINSAVQGQTDGFIQQDQLEALKATLQQYPDYHVIIGCHHHPVAMQSHWIDQHQLKNPHTFLQCLAPFNNIKAVIHGHVHQASAQSVQTIQFLSVPSTCVQFKPHSYDFALDIVAPGYRLLHLYEDGTLETKVYRVQSLVPQFQTQSDGY